MRDSFLDDRGLQMTRTGESTAVPGLESARDADTAAGVDGFVGRPGRHVCPFCGSVNDSGEGPCPRCTMENTAETRKATKSRVGPWYVLQSRNPAAPGMKYDTLLGFVNKGRVKARSIVRGPTTHQLWRFACQVKGLSRAFGVCYSCGGAIGAATHVCPKCNRLQDPPADPDSFLEGLAQPSPAGPASDARAAETSFAVVGGAPASVFELAAPRPPVAPQPVYREVKPPLITLGDDIVVPPLSGVSVVMPEAPAPPREAPAPPRGPLPQPIFPAAAAVAAPPEPVAPVPVAPTEVMTAAVAPPVQPRPQPAPASPAPQASPVPSPASPAGRRKANDVFLSAKDLAAAFQLDFKPDPDSDGGGDDEVAAGTVSARRPAGATAAAMPRPARRRKRRVGRTVLLLLLLVVGGFGALLALNKDYRQRVVDWADAKYSSLTGANLYPDIASQTTVNPRPASRPVPSASTASGGGSGPAGTAPSATRPVTSPVPDSAARAGVTAAPPADRSPVTEASGPAQPPAPTTRATQQPRPVAPAAETTPQPAETAAQRPRPAPPQAAATTRPAPVTLPAPLSTPAAPRPPKLTLADAQQKAKTWYFQALDADAADDLATATKLYKRIMDELPREIDGHEVWPSDVKLRYEQARKALGPQ